MKRRREEAAPDDPGYFMPAGPARAEVRDRGSRFLALLAPATSEEEARFALAEIAARHPDATHHCFAWRVGDPPRERASDAGEPTGTAGLPILRALAAAGLSDALLVIVRWFGGVKLGKGGLARAYAAAAQAAIAAAATERKRPTVELTLEVALADVGTLKRLLRPGELDLVEERYAERATLRLRLPRARHVALLEALAAAGVRPVERGSDQEIGAQGSSAPSA